MKELTLRDLEKMDIIEVTNDELKKITNWCVTNEKTIYDNKNKFKDVFDKIIFKIKDIIVYYEIKKSIINFSVYKNFNTELALLIYSINNEFNLEIGIKSFLQHYYELPKVGKIGIETSDFYKYCSGDINDEKTLEFLEQYLIDYYSVLIYSQLNEKYITKSLKISSYKIQSKKDKRKGKKPKVKLIKQNIIRLNTDHIPEPTEEEINRYERHTFGWTVRGHWRTYQSGKKVWIKPQVRGDKDKVEGKIYEI